MQYIILGAICFIIGAAIMLIVGVIQSRKASRHSKRGKAKKAEYTKAIGIWAAIMATVVVVAAIILSAFDKQPLESLFIAVFTSCSGYLVTAAAKSAYEKNSRNIHGLDENGKPYNIENEDGGTTNEHNTVG